MTVCGNIIFESEHNAVLTPQSLEVSQCRLATQKKRAETF